MQKRALIILLMLPATAMAHPGHDIAGFAAGFVHPFSGLDHTPAMLAVGIWAAMRQRAALQIAGTFLGGMLLGGMLGMQGLVAPMLESLVLGSALLAALLVALAVRLPVSAQLAVTSLFALVHGMAHGMELPGSASALPYAGGFLMATALLILAGWVAGRALGTQRRQRLSGAGLAVAAGSLFFA
jgi:urease accessory protein